MSANQDYLTRLRQIMPWGSSTCSKAVVWPPEEPAVLVRGRGCRVWDADGREFIDFKNALGPVTLGYAFTEVDAAIRRQLENGILFSAPHPLEAETAELLASLVPWLEQVRFLKTGGEAMAACFKIARAYTGRDRIIQIGYNGWLNSLAGGAAVLPGRPAVAVPCGVPVALAQLHTALPWNRVDEVAAVLERHAGEVAAIAVAMDYPGAAAGVTFYPELRRLADRHGCLLIFDEIVTGFRLAHGGVGEYFKVRPDLAVFAKGIANGMPLSAYGGRREVMAVLERAIVSSTHGGETLSLAAGSAVLAFYRDHDVIGHLWRMGKRMWDGVDALFRHYGVPVRTAGLDPVRFFQWEAGNEEVRERVMRAFFRAGVLLYNGGYVNYSHTDDDIDEALARMDGALKQL